VSEECPREEGLESRHGSAHVNIGRGRCLAKRENAKIKRYPLSDRGEAITRKMYGTRPSRSPKGRQKPFAQHYANDDAAARKEMPRTSKARCLNLERLRG